MFVVYVGVNLPTILKCFGMTRQENRSYVYRLQSERLNHYTTASAYDYPTLGVGKLFSRRAALTISRVVEGQGLLSRTAACYRRNCISSQFCEMFWQCGISARKNGGVSKKKRSSPFRRRLMRDWGQL